MNLKKEILPQRDWGCPKSHFARYPEAGKSLPMDFCPKCQNVCFI